MGLRDVRFIGSNPVTAAMDDREKSESAAQDADLSRAVNQASFFRTVGLAPYELQRTQADTRLANDQADITDATKTDVIDTAHDNRRRTKAEADYSEGSLSSRLSDADTSAKNSALTYDTNRQKAPYEVTEAKNNSINSGQRITQTAGEIADAATKRDHDNAIWNLQLPALQADALTGDDKREEAFVRTAATRGIDAAVSIAKQHGMTFSPEVEQIFRDPKLGQSAATVYGKLAALAPGQTDEEIAFRANAFMNAMHAIAKGSSLDEALAAVGNSPITDPLWQKAISQAGEEFKNDVSLDTDTRGPAIDKRAREIYSQLKAGPASATTIQQPPQSAPAPAATSGGSTWYEPWTWGNVAAPRGIKGSGKQNDPWIADTQSDVDWFRQKAPKGAQMNIDGTIYTK
jgi:hypothetical protein